MSTVSVVLLVFLVLLCVCEGRGYQAVKGDTRNEGKAREYQPRELNYINILLLYIHIRKQFSVTVLSTFKKRSSKLFCRTSSVSMGSNDL